MTTPLYLALARLQLEDMSRFSLHNSKEEADRLDRGQRRATKMIKRLENLPYEVFSASRRLRWLQKIQRLSLHKEPRGEDKRQGYKLYQGRFHLDTRTKFFTVRIIIHGNNLPRDMIESLSLEVLKMSLNRVLDNLI